VQNARLCGEKTEFTRRWVPLGEDRPGKENSRIAVGQTRGGRYLRVIYVPHPEPDSVFVITAYELGGKPLNVIGVEAEGDNDDETKYGLAWSDPDRWDQEIDV